MVQNTGAFQGFEEPKFDLNTLRWEDRLKGLAHNHLDEWAKFGPYESLHSVRNATSKLRNKHTENLGEQGYTLDVTYEGDFSSEPVVYYIFVKVSVYNGVQGQGKPL